MSLDDEAPALAGRLRKLDLPRLSAQAKCTFGKNRKSRAQVLAVPLEHHSHKLRLNLWLKSSKSDQQDSRMKQTLPEYEIPKILICRQQDGIGLPAAEENSLIVETGAISATYRTMCPPARRRSTTCLSTLSSATIFTQPASPRGI